MGTIRKRGDKWSYRVDLGAVNGKRMQKEKGGFATKKEAAAAMTIAFSAVTISLPVSSNNSGFKISCAIIPPFN